MAVLKPNLSILPETQRRFWPELSVIPGEFTLKALSYFDDVASLPWPVKERLGRAAAAVDPTRLPVLAACRPRPIGRAQ